MTDLWPLAALLGLLGSTAVVLTLLDWRVGALVLSLVLPFEGLLPQLGASGMKVLVVMTLLALAIHLARDAALRARLLANLRTDLSLLLLALTALCAASALWAVSAEAALGRTLTFAGVFVLLQLFALLDPRHLRLAWLVLLGSAALTVPAGLLLGVDSVFAADGRFTSGGLNPNDYAGVLLVILLVGSVAAAGIGGRVVMLALAAVVLGGILLSGTRTAFLALAAAPLVHLVLSPARGRALAQAAIAYGCAAAVVGGIHLLHRPQAEAVEARALTLANPGGESTVAARLAMWQGGWDIVRDHPLLGAGAGNFPYVAPRYMSLSSYAAEGRPGPVSHNIFVGVTAELGLAGLALFAALLWRALARARAVSRSDPFGSGLMLGLVGYVLMGLALSWEYSKIGYVVMGSLLALAPRPGLAAVPDSAEDAPEYDARGHA